ncbi:hypothetical protein BC833DRAFT_604593 [Globomyces pollinis-pini]|nr:hypothetical protein BC833DRAFT_604593 [Globomyces pollinis-pini]
MIFNRMLNWTWMGVRTYKKHICDKGNESLGRSVVVNGNPNASYGELRRILQESKVRETIRAQSRFEKAPEARRRKRKERDFDRYLKGVKYQVKAAFDLKVRTERAKKSYEDL